MTQTITCDRVHIIISDREAIEIAQQFAPEFARGSAERDCHCKIFEYKRRARSHQQNF